jgi:hypothetical protein
MDLAKFVYGRCQELCGGPKRDETFVFGLNR